MNVLLFQYIYAEHYENDQVFFFSPSILLRDLI